MELATIALSERARPAVTAEMELRCPRRSPTRCRVDTIGGDIQVYDIRGAVQAESGGGLIQMDRIGSDVSAKTGGGEIRLREYRRIDPMFLRRWIDSSRSRGKESWLETAGGDIFVRESGGPIHTSTAGGNIRCSAQLPWSRRALPADGSKSCKRMASCWPTTRADRFRWVSAPGVRRRIGGRKHSAARIFGLAARRY